MSEPLFDSLFGGSTPNYGKIAASSAGKRKGIIDLGLKQINAVYDGGTAPFYNAAYVKGKGFKPGQDYYTLGAQGFTPYWAGGVKPEAQKVKDVGIALNLFNGGFFGAGEKKISPLDVARKTYAKGQLYTKGEDQTFEGFQPSFYQQRAQAYNDFALPQVAEQYRLNRDALNYGLFNRGLGTSSIADRGRSQVQRISDTARQNVVDTGIDQANELKRNVESARQENIKQLYQTADPAQALQSAIFQASQLRAPSVFQPVGDLFTNLARQYYINQTLNNYRQGSGVAPNNSTGYNLSGALGPVTS